MCKCIHNLYNYVQRGTICIKHHKALINTISGVGSMGAMGALDPMNKFHGGITPMELYTSYIIDNYGDLNCPIYNQV